MRFFLGAGRVGGGGGGDVNACNRHMCVSKAPARVLKILVKF